MIVAYVTAIESQDYLSDKPDWLALTDAEQDDHLSWGRYYIDEQYTCPYDETDASDELKFANSLAGYLNLSGTLYVKTDSIRSSSVSAGSVSSSKEFVSPSSSGKPLEFAKIASLLEADCQANKSDGTVGLSRS